MNRHVRYCTEQMAKLYAIFTSPMAVIDKASGEVLRISFEWTNQEAKELYSEWLHEIAALVKGEGDADNSWQDLGEKGLLEALAGSSRIV